MQIVIHADYVGMVGFSCQNVTVGRMSSMGEKFDKLASFESHYNDTGLPLVHGHMPVVTRSVSWQWVRKLLTKTCLQL